MHPSRLTRHAALVALFVLVLALGAGAEEEGAPAFPKDGLMPKKEIGADRFLAKHPEADGRGITVAIFDTGVDPGAPGLQTTPDGRPKIVDLVDGSGSGDVDTSMVRKAKDGKLKGLSGRTLTLGALTCPKNAWHVGIKPAFELFPSRLVSRLKQKRRKLWDETQRATQIALVRQIAALEDASAAKDRKQRRELGKRLEQLKALQKGYDDPGPVYDCAVFHDGKVWRAVIDTDEDGDLGDEKALAAFRLEHKYGTFSDEARLNYGINVYDAGKRLSIVVDCGAHGTHVAGIVAAHYPDQPELNGIAPGAQIVAVKIGDTRMGSSSMGTGEERGLVAVLRNKCQLINMSYGGPTPTPNRTRMEKLYAEVVNEHGVIFVSSAGNEGPALSTVVAPGGTSSAIFGVGAYVSPEMMKAQYALRKTTAPTHFTWSSRGPTADGDLGVDFSAPGGAVAPVPNWLLQGSTHMNGTSMSAPNLCGGVALLLSGLKAKSIGWSAHRVRRALANSAKQVEGIDPFAMGRGLIQVPEAFAYLERWKDKPEEDARFQVTFPRRDDARGLYLREPGETSRVIEERVQIKPHFREDEDHETRIAFSMRLRLEATQPWIEVPGHLALQHGGGRFEVRVDPTKLEAGHVHYGEVLALDADAPERGAIFRVPVTVVRPDSFLAPEAPWKETLRFREGTVERRFFAVPAGATWADLKLTRLRAAGSEGPKPAEAARLIVLQTQQLVPGQHFKENNLEDYLRLDPGASVARSFKVAGDRTLEVALAQYWSSLGDAEIEAELHFHGLHPANEKVHMDGADLVTHVDVTVPFGREQLAPSAKLETLRRRLRPVKFEVQPGEASRDTLSRGRVIHEAVLSYDIELEEDARVRPTSFQGFFEDIYESWSSALWMVFDKNKRRVATGPVWGDKTVKLAKGTYRLRLHLRHEDPLRLEEVRGAILYLDIKLGSSVRLPIYPSGEALLGSSPRFKSREVQQGDRVRLYLAPPAHKALPKLAEPGDLLLGKLYLGEKDDKRFGAGRRPGGWPLSVQVPPAPSKKTEKKDEAEPGEKAKPEKPLDALKDEVIELKVSKLRSLRRAGDKDAFAKLAAEILRERAGHLPVLVEQLKLVDGKGPPYRSSRTADRVLNAAKRIVRQIDTARLAAHLGRKDKATTSAEKVVDRRMKMRRDALIDALVRKARAEASGGEAKRKAFHGTFAELETWADVEGSRFLPLRVDLERSRGRLSSALAHVRAQMAKQPDDRGLQEMKIALLKELGWKHWAARERAWLAIRFPSAYPPF